MQTWLVASHAMPVGQSPQARLWPQPSPMLPQYWPPATEQVCGTQAGSPQTLGMPVPPQVSGAVQVSPHTIGWPQPSPIVPQ